MTIREPLPTPPGYMRIPSRLNLVREVLDSPLAAGGGERIAFVADAGQLSVGDLHARVNAFAAACARQGIGRGDRVLIRMWNCFEFVIAFLGIARIGAVPVMQNSVAGSADVEYVVDHSDAVAAVTLAELAMPLRQLKDRLAKGLIVARGAQTGDLVFENMIETGAFETADTAADEPAMMCYTSGTTGRPKGIVHAHRWIIARGDPNRLRVPAADGDVVMASGEWSFISLLGHNVLFPLRNGVTGAVLEGRPTPERVLRAIQDHRVTVLYAVPTIYRRILAETDIEKRYRLDTLRVCNASGEALGAATAVQWKERVGVDILEHYGISEMQMVIGNSPLMPNKPGSVGVPWGVKAEIVDEFDAPLPTDTVGQLVFDSDNPSLFLGYHKDPQKTAEVLRGGWLRTGDLAYRDADGYFWIAGRNDDCFKSKGVFISPVEVESALLECPGVAEACVVPAPDGMGGLLIRAVIVMRADAGEHDDVSGYLKSMLREKIARNKIPTVFDFVRELPKSANGKVLRRALAPA